MDMAHQQPPADLPTLRARAEESLGRNAQAIFNKMIAEPQFVAMETSSATAARYGVNPSTLTRIAQRLGYTKYSELQKIFREKIISQAGYYADRASKLQNNKEISDGKFIDQIMQKEIQNIKATSLINSQQQIDLTTKNIIKARRIYVLGLRATYSLAYFFSSFLAFVRPNVRLLGGAGYSIAEELSRCTEDDLVVIFTFRPYTKAVVDIILKLRQQQQHVLIITDVTAPFVKPGKYEDCIFVESPFMLDSALANLFVVELILSNVTKNMGEEALEYMYEIESRLEAFEIELDEQEFTALNNTK